MQNIYHAFYPIQISPMAQFRTLDVKFYIVHLMYEQFFANPSANSEIGLIADELFSHEF